MLAVISSNCAEKKRYSTKPAMCKNCFLSLLCTFVQERHLASLFPRVFIFTTGLKVKIVLLLSPPVPYKWEGAWQWQVFFLFKNYFFPLHTIFSNRDFWRWERQVSRQRTIPIFLSSLFHSVSSDKQEDKLDLYYRISQHPNCQIQQVNNSYKACQLHQALFCSQMKRGSHTDLQQILELHQIDRKLCTWSVNSVEILKTEPMYLSSKWNVQKKLGTFKIYVE